MKRLARMVVIAFVGSITLLAFQNCGPAGLSEPAESQNDLDFASMAEKNNQNISEADYDANCENFFKGTVVREGEWRSCEISESVKLSSKQTIFTHALSIQKSDITLDCNGSIIDGQYDEKIEITQKGVKKKYKDERSGLTIKPPKNGTPPANILVKNCIFKNISGVSLAVRTNLDDVQSYEIIVDQKKTYEALRAYSPRNVVLQNISSYNSGRTGIYFYPGVTGAKLLNSDVIESGLSKVSGRASRNAPAVYIDAGAKGIVLDGNIFKGNTREGVALDSSGDNTITNNTFSKQKQGSIFLYKNCQEKFLKKPLKPKKDYEYHRYSKPRLDPSSRNNISGNIFQDEEIGIWIASRQAKDLGTWGCGDASPYENPVSGAYLYLDYAKDNIIRDNSFKNVKTGLIVEDDGTKIEGNTFSGGDIAVSVGTKYRAELLNKPVKGTVIKNNKFGNWVGAPIELKYKSTGTDMDISLEVKSYKGYLVKDKKQTAFWTPGETIRQVAMDHCNFKRKENPQMGIICTWGTENLIKDDGPVAKPTPKPTPQPSPSPSKPVSVKDFSCGLWSNDNGCKKTVQCPTGKKIVGIRAACNLETPDVTPAQVNGTSWNLLKVVKASDVVKDGTCSIKISGVTTALSSGSKSLTFTPANAMEVFCKEKDSNGGDCEIRGEVKCQ